MDIKTYKSNVLFYLMELVIFLGEDRESWAQGQNLILKGEWDNVLVVGGDYAKDFSVEGKKFELIKCSVNGKLVELKKEFLQKLKNKIDGTEVALSIASGNGKEHMALISALLSVPAGIRFSAATKEGVVFL
jgi:hypothetical protein